MQSVTQLSLQLFDPPSFAALVSRMTGSPALTVAADPRLKRGWKVTVTPATGGRRLIVPRFLLNAPQEIKQALIAWALLPLRSRGDARRRRRLLEKTIWGYIESLPDAPRRISRFDARDFAGKTAGRRYDLREVFDYVNKTEFSGAVSAIVRWGAKGSRTSYHTVKTDKHGVRVNLITIAGAYDRSDVPRFAIEAVMHHEMLHIVIPPYRGNGRMVVHGREFKAAERNFRHYAQWRAWEREYTAKTARK